MFSAFFIFASLFGTEGSAHDSAEGAVKILGRKVVDACFYFEVDVLLNEEGLGKVS